MKRLMLTALMGCMLMGQIKASDSGMYFVAGQDGLKKGLALGAGLPLVVGGIIALGTQASHMNEHQFKNSQNGPNIFFHGLNKVNIQPNTFFTQNEPIPNLGYRFAHWTKITSLCGMGLAAFAKLYTTLYPSKGYISSIAEHENFVKNVTICVSLLGTAVVAHFMSEAFKPRTKSKKTAKIRTFETIQ